MTKKQERAAMLRQVENGYNSRESSYYRLVENTDKGTCMVAARDIQAGEAVLVEKPMYTQPVGYSEAFCQRPDVAPLLVTITRYAQSHGHLTGPEQYPLEARETLNRLTELKVTEVMTQSPRIHDIWQLHDAHRCAQIGDNVMIDGLVSDSGKVLNGRFGRVVGVDDRDNSRLAVEIGSSRSTRTMRKSIKAANLKTLGGILRTNAFGNYAEGTETLFQVLSRVNHACGDTANVMKMDANGKAYLMAKRDIRDGEEILIDYLPGERGDRVGLLEVKYNFRCTCGGH